MRKKLFQLLAVFSILLLGIGQSVALASSGDAMWWQVGSRESDTGWEWAQGIDASIQTELPSSVQDSVNVSHWVGVDLADDNYFIQVGYIVDHTTDKAAPFFQVWAIDPSNPNNDWWNYPTNDLVYSGYGTEGETGGSGSWNRYSAVIIGYTSQNQPIWGFFFDGNEFGSWTVPNDNNDDTLGTSGYNYPRAVSEVIDDTNAPGTDVLGPSTFDYAIEYWQGGTTGGYQPAAHGTSWHKDIDKTTLSYWWTYTSPYGVTDNAFDNTFQGTQAGNIDGGLW